MKYKQVAVKKKKEKIYPSSFGSHKSMLSPQYEDFNGNPDEVNVICEDAYGLYVTTKEILDSGFADGDRNRPIARRIDLFQKFIRSNEYH